MTMTISQPPVDGESRAKRLKALTHETHDQLDKSIMSAASFASVENYGRFVTVQYLFHRDIDALYGNAVLQALLPGLAERRRLPLIAADLTDLALPLPDDGRPLVFAQDEALDVPAALGWLYVAEGSNMGAALLRKEVSKIGLSDEHGARHLAPAAEGPAVHWRAFIAALDAAELTTEDEAGVVAGANAAFARVQALVDARIG